MSNREITLKSKNQYHHPHVQCLFLISVPSWALDNQSFNVFLPYRKHTGSFPIRDYRSWTNQKLPCPFDDWNQFLLQSTPLLLCYWKKTPCPSSSPHDS